MTLKNFSIVFFLIMMASCGVCMAAHLYQVGDSAGWTSLGDIDYQQWAAKKKFHVGDTLVFHHNQQFHDVKQVNRQDFESCNPATPTYSYHNRHGYDSVTLNGLGHFYFISAFPDNCQAGQKVDILVTPETSSPSSSPSVPNSGPSPSPAAPKSGVSVTSNLASSASSSLNYFSILSWTLSGLAFCLLALAH